MKLLVLLLAAIAGCTVADMFAEVTVLEYINRSGQSADGKCCDQKTAANCRCGFLCNQQSYCDYIFEVCIEPLPSATTDLNNCQTGWKTSNVVANNQNNVVLQHPHNYGGMPNPFRVNVIGTWQGALFKYRVWDDDGFGRKELVDQNFYQLDANFKTQQFYHKNVTHSRLRADPTMMKIQVYLNCLSGFGGPNCEQVAYQDCAAYYKAGQMVSGVYNLAYNGITYKARCDMTTDGGGWTVIQDRTDGSMDFDRSFPEYQQGFGQPPFNRDYWYGLDKISALTNGDEQMMRVEVSDCVGNQRSEVYQAFKIGGLSDNYRLQLSQGAGVMGDSMNTGNADTTNVGMAFSTYDRDSDRLPGGNCADMYKGGWWYNKCTDANLNGQYYSNCQTNGNQRTGIFWESWRGVFYSLRSTRMMIRPRNFLQMVNGTSIVEQPSVAILEA